MAKKTCARLLASELEILQVLWNDGPLTIVEVQRQLPRASGYTTVQTRLNRMLRKGLLDRSEARPSHYSAAITRAEASAVDLGLLISKVNDGNVIPLVAQLIRCRSLTQQELIELKAMIRDAELEARTARAKGAGCD